MYKAILNEGETSLRLKVLPQNDCKLTDWECGSHTSPSQNFGKEYMKRLSIFLHALRSEQFDKSLISFAQ